MLRSQAQSRKTRGNDLCLGIALRRTSSDPLCRCRSLGSHQYRHHEVRWSLPSPESCMVLLSTVRDDTWSCLRYSCARKPPQLSGAVNTINLPLQTGIIVCGLIVTRHRAHRRRGDRIRAAGAGLLHGARGGEARAAGCAGHQGREGGVAGGSCLQEAPGADAGLGRGSAGPTAW